MNQSRKQVNSAVFLALIVLILGLTLSLNRQTKADTSGKLYFLPATGSFEVGKTFSVKLMVESDVTSFNLVDANLSFSNATLQVVSLSKDGSIMKLWLNDPAFSNSEGTISVAGGIPNPGYIGIGRVIIINFKTKAAGNGWIKTSFGQILANDGQGTNILSSSGQVNFTIYSTGLPQPKIVQPSTKGSTTPPLPTISSSTHPSPEKWYNNKNILLSWIWTRGITDYSFSFDHNTTTTPDNIGEGVNNTAIAYNNVADGVWYFHLKAKISNTWSSPVHFRIQIDSQAPTNLKISWPNPTATTYQTKPFVDISASDTLSGIDHYEITVDGGQVQKTSQSECQLGKQNVGQHNVTIRAYDKAGNFTETSSTYTIIPLPAPKITYWTKQTLYTEYTHSLVIKGNAVPLSDIEIIILRGNNQFLTLNTKTNETGVWQSIYEEPIPVDYYNTYALAYYEERVSPPSHTVSFQVLDYGIKIFGLIIPKNIILWITIFLLCCIAILVVIILFLKEKIRISSSSITKSKDGI